MKNSYGKSFFEKTLLFSIVFLFFSCSNKTEKNIDADKITLRYEIEKKLEAFSWSDELEPGRLTKNTNRYGNISDRVKLSPLAVICDIPESNDSENPDIDSGKKSDVFPYIEGFGSLDISETPSGVLASVNNFCNLILKNEEADSSMAVGSLYSLALFYYSLGDRKFDKFIVGSSFVTGTSYEVPVRFFSAENKSAVDVDLFLIKESGIWKIDQIYLKKGI